MSNRLTMLDASFLSMESAATPMHSGGLGIFEEGLRYHNVLETLVGRLDGVPLARRRVRDVAFGAGRPVWADDPHFDISYHLRHAALPPPGDPGQLGEFLSRLIGRLLDRSRPLWELYVIEGLEGGRVAVFRKMHLAMAGGDRHDPFGLLLDADPHAPRDQSRERWEPRPPPSTTALALEAARERADQALTLSRRVRGMATDPSAAADAAFVAAGAAVGLAARVLSSPPSTPLNRRLTPHRRFATARVPLSRLRAVRRRFGGSINDAVLTVAADATGRLLRWRGHDTKDLDLKVMVPVRVHGNGEGETPLGMGESRTLDDGVVAVLAPFPVMEMDPVARLYRVMGEMAGIKESRQAVAADSLVRLAGYAPPNLHALAARVASGEARYNVALSNAPGPQEPRWLAGHRMLESYPFIPLAGNATLSIAVSSYAGDLFFGLLADRTAVPDLEELPRFVDDAAEALAAAAES